MMRILSEQKLEQLIQERVKQVLSEKENDFEKAALLQQANLQTLQSQINPHFLYNTLECIRGMALIEGKENIADIAMSLSRFFRYSISGKSDIVTLRDELENCQIYTKIQNYRFWDRFRLQTDIAPDILDCVMPKLILQPIIENAIIHGLQNTLENGTVRILAEKTDDIIHIQISDNGSGMSPEVLAALSERILHGNDQKTEGRHTGIAMHNVDRRLKLMFGQEYGLAVFSCEGVGTDVEIRIPYQVGEVQ